MIGCTGIQKRKANRRNKVAVPSQLRVIEMIFRNEWYLFAQEASLSHANLLAGFDALRKVNAEQRGNFYSAFFGLSIGLERLFKIVVVLDFKKKHSLAKPTNRDLRRMGHCLSESYQRCKKIGKSYQLPDDFAWSEEGSPGSQFLDILSEFASGSRYYNLDQIVGEDHHKEPIKAWIAIQKKIGLESLSGKRLEKANQTALDFCENMGAYGYTRSVDGEYRLFSEHIFLNNLLIAASGHCVWELLRVIRPLYYVIKELVADIHSMEISQGIEPLTVPYLEEYFVFLLAKRRTAIRRKKWQSLFDVN